MAPASKPPRAYWLCAEPATFEVGRGDVRLSDTVRDLAASETTALLSSLNAHFASDGIRFEAPDAVHWLVGAEAPQSLSTLPPERVHRQAAARSSAGRTPTPGVGAAWHNEIQMLLFEHPVNVAREAAGRALVNSVWLWGGGAAGCRTNSCAGSPRSTPTPGGGVNSLAQRRRVRARPGVVRCPA